MQDEEGSPPARTLAAATGVAIVLLLARPAAAYLDPGTGSYLFQVLVASVLGALFAIKLYWARLVSRLKDLFSRKPK